MLLYATNKWRIILSPALWPYTLHTANEIHNSTPLKQGGRSPIELFSGMEVSPKLKHFHVFGCPVYMLDSKLQSGLAIPKWKARSHLGMYLGPSPNHAHSVSLVLNPQT